MLFNRKSNKQQDNKHGNQDLYSNSLAENSLLLSRLNGRQVKYVSLRKGMESGETIIGKDGVINIINNEEIAILCNTRIVFRHKLCEIKADELMSLAGVNLRYKDEANGQNISIIAYYKYYRK